MQNYSFFVFVSQTQKRIGELMSSARHSFSILHYPPSYMTIPVQVVRSCAGYLLVKHCTCGSWSIEKTFFSS